MRRFLFAQAQTEGKAVGRLNRPRGLAFFRRTLRRSEAKALRGTSSDAAGPGREGEKERLGRDGSIVGAKEEGVEKPRRGSEDGTDCSENLHPRMVQGVRFTGARSAA